MNRLPPAIFGLLIILCLSVGAAAQGLTDPLKEAQRLTRVAQVAEQQGRYMDAIKAYQTISLIAKSSPKTAASALQNAGTLYMMIGKFNEAIASFRASIDLEPTAVAQNSLG